MIPLPLRRPATRVSFALALLFAGSSASLAQTVFVCLGGKAKLASIIAIPPPGHGWDFSAAAPVAGTQWNRVRRTAGVDVSDPSIPGAPAVGAIRLGLHALDTADDIALVDPQGNPTSVRLTARLEVQNLATDKARMEPSIHSKSAGAVPAGLMDASWRVYLPENRLHFALSGLVPRRAYELYVYGASVDPESNPTGDGEGARFSLAPENAAPGSSGTSETIGGFCGSIYTFNPETNLIAPSPAGTTWAKLAAVADDKGRIAFSTAQNSRRRHYVNGFQLVETDRP